MKKTITVEGFEIGTGENHEALTGVSVIIAKEGAVAGCCVRGSAPGTRETDLLKSEKTVEQVHSVVLSGGSAFGLESTCGVMNYLEAMGVGFDVGVARVPIVCGAVLFDLAVGNPDIRPDKEMGYLAAKKASTEIFTGNIGAGCGATVGKLRGFDTVMKGGTGYIELCLESGLKVGAYVCVNACGEVYEGETILAGALNDDKTEIISSHQLMLEGAERDLSGKNTTIGCILTNAKLTKTECNKVAEVAHNGYALSIRPIHTSMDGDTIFTLASGIAEANLDTVCYLAQEAMKLAVIDAIKSAESVQNIPSYRSTHSISE